MRIIEYFAQDGAARAHWRREIGRGDWSAAKFLRRMLEEDALKERCGPNARVLLGIEREELAAFCTYVDRDDVDCPETPWVGFVYTFPAYRGRRRSGELIEYAYILARAEGHGRMYLSTNEIGLYEKYGFAFLRMDRDVWGGETRVYVREI